MLLFFLHNLCCSIDEVFFLIFKIARKLIHALPRIVWGSHGIMLLTDEQQKLSSIRLHEASDESS